MRYFVAVFLCFAFTAMAAPASPDCEEIVKAIERGDTAHVEEWLKHKPDPNDECSQAALDVAARHHRHSLVQSLLAHGVNVNAMRGDLTPLMEAIASGMPILYSSEHVLTVQILLDNGADITARSHNGWTALVYAAWNGDAAIVRLLLDKGADVNLKDKQGRTALMWAVLNASLNLDGHAAVVSALLAKGADANAKDEDGNTALMYAKQHDFNHLVRVFNQAASKHDSNE